MRARFRVEDAKEKSPVLVGILCVPSQKSYQNLTSICSFRVSLLVVLRPLDVRWSWLHLLPFRFAYSDVFHLASPAPKGKSVKPVLEHPQTMPWSKRLTHPSVSGA
jgi:hypothetical protein